MTSEPAPRRLGLGGVVAALIVLVCIVILAGLGVWQVRRLHWKEGVLARVAAAQRAAPQPIGLVLARLKQGQDVEWTRVEANCARDPAPAPVTPRYGVRDGEVVWRATQPCRLAGAAYPWIVLDRGVIDASRGQVQAPRKVSLPAPGAVTGVLRQVGRRAEIDRATAAGAAPLGLVVDRETPPAPGITPAPYPTNIPNNHLGYAITWFGLALALAGVYAGAVLKRRARP